MGIHQFPPTPLIQNGPRQEGCPRFPYRLHDGRCLRCRRQDGSCPHRANQAPRPEPGRDDQAGPSRHPVRRHRRLRSPHLRRRGSRLLLERKHRQRHPLLPDPGAQLRLQDYFKSLFGYKKERDGYAWWMFGNLAAGGGAGASSLLFVYSLDFARTRLANDNKSSKKGGERQFNGLLDVYKKTLATDGIAGLYRGFVPSVVGIVVYRGLYFGMYDSL